jgi:hypothetical protein
MNLSGNWEGKLLDTSGSAARVTTSLKLLKNRVTGDFSVYFESARDGCDFTGWKLAQTAPMSGTYTARGDKLRLKYKLEIGSKPVDVVFQARIINADPHARRALVGSYTVTDKEQEIGFEGGVCLLWLYR